MFITNAKAASLRYGSGVGTCLPLVLLLWLFKNFYGVDNILRIGSGGLLAPGKA